MWKDLQVTPTIVTANQKGVVALASDPRISDGKTGSVEITVPTHPGVKTDLEVPFRYNVAFTANFSGASGSDGFPGTDGTAGMSGSDGSTDPNSPSPGGNGSNGSDGGNGGDGGNGRRRAARNRIRNVAGWRPAVDSSQRLGEEQTEIFSRGSRWRLTHDKSRWRIGRQWWARRSRRRGAVPEETALPVVPAE